MMTLGDIERLLPEARAEAAKVDTAGATGKDGPVPLLGAALDATHEAARLLSLYHVIRWLDVRALCLRAAWMLLVVAWEAGMRSRTDDTTSPATPEAKRDEVDELIRNAEAVATGGSHTWIGVRDTIMWLTAALRAERTRADGWRRVGEDNDRHAFEARGHLAAVLAHGWPEGTTAPACVREARAFLAGETPKVPTCAFCNAALEDQSFQGLADRIDVVTKLRAELAASDEALAHERAEVAALRGELAAEQGKTKVHLDAANAWRERFNAEEKRRKDLAADVAELETAVVSLARRAKGGA